MKSVARLNEGRNARLRAEIDRALLGKKVIARCVYRRIEQRNQFFKGWHSVTQIDIDVAIAKACGASPLQQQTVSQRNYQCNL